MLDFDMLVSGLQENRDNPEEYFVNFFSRSNRKQYHIDSQADDDQVKAIRILFDSKKDLRDRIDQSFSFDPLCLEAFFIYYITSDDVFVDYRFKTYYDQIGRFPDLSAYQKKCYLKIMDFYVEFLLDIGNYTTAIKVQRQIIKLGNVSQKDIDRLSFMYCVIERADDFYRLYLDHMFDAYDYLLLIVTLLKHEDEIRAKEVTQDMFRNIPETEYLDHLWDLDDKDEQQQTFYKTVDECYEYIRGVPDFFTFINRVHQSTDHK